MDLDKETRERLKALGYLGSPTERSIKVVDDALRPAVELFNHGRFTEFQDALEKVAAATRAASERQFYTLLAPPGRGAASRSATTTSTSAEATHRAASLRKLDEFVPRFRGLNIEALREDFRACSGAARGARGAQDASSAPTQLPRLRVLPE